MDPDQKEEEMSSDKTAKGSCKKDAQKAILKKISQRRESARKKLTEDSEHVIRHQTEKFVDHNFQEDVADVEKQRSVTEALRGRVREKLKTYKVTYFSWTCNLLSETRNKLHFLCVRKAESSVNLENFSAVPHCSEHLQKLSTRSVKVVVQEEKSTDKSLSDTKIYQKNLEIEILSDDSLAFFIMTGEEGSELKDLDKSTYQHKLIHDSHRNLDVLNDESSPLLDIVEEVLLPDVLEVKAAEYECNELRINKQWEHLFVPSSSPVVHSFKLPKGMMPRILEDEGLYIPRKPETCRRSYNKMENRLLKQEGGKNWFEESGEIISLPSPIKQSRNFRKCFPLKTGPGLKTIYKKAMLPELESCIITKSGGQRELYQLDLNISSLLFSHHPLFSQEHVLTARLLQLYECFQNRQQHNIALLLSEKLKALINATKIVESGLEASQPSRKTLEDYQWQIRDTKKLYDLEHQKDISLIHSMLKVWKQIKSVRRQQDYTSTPVKLQFQKRLTKKNDEDEYKAGLAQDAEKDSGLEGEDNIDNPDNISQTWGKQKGCLDSAPPLASSAQLAEIKEPFFMPHLTLTAEITAMSKCPMYEQKRRAKVQRQQYFIKIFYNEKQVSCTSVAPLQMDFRVMFQQIFSIQLLNWPESLRLEICESAKRTNVLAKIYLPIPDNTVLKSKGVLEQAEFSCDQQVKPINGEVGSNVPFLLDENETEEVCLLTSGKLMYSLSWAVDEGGIPLAPESQKIISACYSVPRNINAEIATGLLWFTDRQKLTEWAKEVKIDPNDPEYSDLMEFIMYARSKEQTVSKYFRLEQLQEEFNFVTEEEIKKCKRFQLLQLRNSEQFDFCHFRQIPLYDREIPDAVIQEYESQLEKDISMTDVDPITAQRIRSANFIRKMRKLILKRLVKVKHKFNLMDIVSDYEEIISMSQLRNAVFKLGERRRHLKPQRKERKKVPAQTVSDGDLKLLIRILRAYNIPSRNPSVTRPAGVHSPAYAINKLSRSQHLLSGKSSYTSDPLSEVSVCPFVEVSFQHTVYRTSTADGSHPCWNEELQVDFISPGHDYSFSGLSKIKDNIYVNIFDEVRMEKHEDTCLKGCSGHSYIRKNWFGSVTFPFSALLEQSKICGTFQVNTPPVLLGYTWSKTCVSPTEEHCGQNLKEYTFLTIFATIEPQLSSVENDSESDKFTDREDETLLQRACIFKKNCKAKFPKRRITTSVFDNEGRNTLVTKYIRALNPPQLLLDMYPDDPNATFDLISRFVSLIPCVSDTLNENADVDVWMTSEHCINLAVGNKEEHAVLLCNYLLYFGKKAWVLLGTSVLEGKVAYVLTHENEEYFLWNPLNGQCYKQFDTFCPLQSVDCLINWENVWFNTQQNSSPMCVSFEISKEGFWRQFLPHNFQCIKTQTVQPKVILYTPTNGSMVEELQNRIEKTLKSKIMEWRFHQPTRWHRQCIALLRQILPKLELRNRSFVTDKEENELESLLEHYWVTGYPIQMPYTDLSSISEAMYQTGIHSSEIPNTEFALAVYIHPYPNNILSVWIYLVSLVRHQ
ncbi:protein CC2D2B isoform X2 [Chelonia mydas]|uniref:protein CC2D2B isoform X2 n=1 Tax=Chelonia mydas TaxID=8469 RepID=UPI001CA911D5|nr:protein CC2D2B isoform X2 [Chelonia mydas]